MLILIINNMSLSLFVLVVVFLGIALRQLFRIPLKIWEMMGIGALTVLFTKQIPLVAAWEAIEWDVIFFLFGMFVVGQALESSGALITFTEKLKLDQCSLPVLGLLIVFGSGFLSALLMNDTVAIVGTPLLITIGRHRGIAVEKLLLLLAFSVTIGSVMSPIGNPQNLFIALKTDIASPFATFLSYLALPTLINLFLLYLVSLLLMRKKKLSLSDDRLVGDKNSALQIVTFIAVGLIIFMILTNIVSFHFDFKWRFPLPLIALIPALLILVVSSERKEILKDIDWPTLVFFIAMFILMESVWLTSTLKEGLSALTGKSITLWGILTMGLLLSQLISNVPMVALYLPILDQLSQGTSSLMALAAGSTVAGNFLIFGAASNIIIIQNAEKRGEKGFSFFQFAKYGIPFSLVNLLVYWGFLYISSAH